MIALGLIAALGTILIAGFGATLLLMRGATRVNFLEAAALSWLLGSGIVSLLLWTGGMWSSGPSLQVATGTAAIALGVWGFVAARRDGLRVSWPKPLNPFQWTFGLLVAAEILIITYLSFRHGLNWDGLLNWEVKARYAFQNDGVIPGAFYASETRGFTHPDYPLLIPMTELWLYLAMGEPHQFWIKIIFPLYYAAGVILLVTTANRLTSRSWPGFVAAALLFFVPCLTNSPGGAIGGYIDVPLSVLYLAATAYLLLSAIGDDPRAWRLSASCLALLPWAKREGAILWAIAVFCAAFTVWRQRRWSAFLWLAPGVVLIVSWKCFLVVMKATQPSEFLPINLTSLRAGLPRLLPVSHMVFGEMFEKTRWGVFWLIALLAFAYLLVRARDRRFALLFIAVAAPISAYAGTYLFSTWPDFSAHFRASFPRLLLHVMPTAWLAIAIALAGPLRSLAKAQLTSHAQPRLRDDHALQPDMLHQFQSR